MSQGRIPVPEGAVGRAGMLVSLRRIKDMDDGRLGIVKHPVGWVKDLLGANHEVFAWQVFLTGEPVNIHGHMTQEVIVADHCLRPVSQLEKPQVQEILDDHQQSEIDAAVAEVKSLLPPGEMESPGFERVMHLALNEAILHHIKEVVGVEATLKDMGFWLSNSPDGESYEWKSVFQGQEIRMTTAPGMFRDWRVLVNSSNSRRIFGGERVMLNDWPRGKIVQTLLELWEDVYGKQLIPQQFEIGWLYRQHIQDMRSIEPVMPNVYLDGESFRRALRWLREAYKIDDEFIGPPKDMPLSVEIKDGVLRLTTEDHSIGVTLRRGWIDAIQLSLRCLLIIPPSALRGHRVQVQWTGTYALIYGYRVDAWSI